MDFLEEQISPGFRQDDTEVKKLSNFYDRLVQVIHVDLVELVVVQTMADGVRLQGC